MQHIQLLHSRLFSKWHASITLYLGIHLVCFATHNLFEVFSRDFFWLVDATLPWCFARKMTEVNWRLGHWQDSGNTLNKCKNLNWGKGNNSRTVQSVRKLPRSDTHHIKGSFSYDLFNTKLAKCFLASPRTTNLWARLGGQMFHEGILLTGDPIQYVEIV